MTNLVRSGSSIVFCNPSFLPVVGGIEKWILQVASRLVDGRDMYVITGRLSPVWPRQEAIAGIHVWRYETNALRWLPSRLLQWFETFYITRRAALISRTARHTVFNFFDPRPAQVYASRWLKRRWVQAIVCSVCGTASELAALRLKQQAVQVSDVLVGLSEYAVRAFGVPHPNTQICYPVGAVPADFASRTADFESKQVLTVCRVHPRKNLEFLIDVAAGLRDLSFVVAGDNTLHREYYQSLVDRATKHGVKNVRFIGPVDEAHLDRLYRSSALFFLPSHHEMFGIVFGEAMSYGLPVVAPRHTAIPEAVGDGNGILYEPGDTATCRQAIHDLTTRRECWVALSDRSKAFMAQRYTQDYIGQYARVLATLAEET